MFRSPITSSRVNLIPIINVPIVHEKTLMFKGPDGKDYATSEGLADATKSWKRQFLRFKGPDGRECADMEGLRIAKEVFFDSMKIRSPEMFSASNAFDLELAQRQKYFCL